jgi:hypothetical protein
MLLGTNTNTRTIIKFVYKNTFSSDLVLFNDTKALETTCSLPSSSKKKKIPSNNNHQHHYNVKELLGLLHGG